MTTPAQCTSHQQARGYLWAVAAWLDNPRNVEQDEAADEVRTRLAAAYVGIGKIREVTSDHSG